MPDEIRVEDADGVRSLIIARPTKKNALTIAMYEAMSRALEEAASNDEIVLVRILADGPAFSAGNDLSDFLTQPPTGADSPVMRFLAVLSSFPKPLLASVRGAAVGIGTTLLLHCDLAWAAPDARFSLPFVRLGLVPEAGSSLLLPGLLGHRRAFELLVLGTPFGAEDAVRFGLINGVADDPDATVDAACAALLKLPREAVTESKRLLREASGRAVPEAMAREGQAFVARLASDEFKAAVSAFFAR